MLAGPMARQERSFRSFASIVTAAARAVVLTAAGAAGFFGAASFAAAAGAVVGAGATAAASAARVSSAARKIRAQASGQEMERAEGGISPRVMRVSLVPGGG